MDMTSGPILGKLISFTLPVLLGNVLQMLYNAADVIVVGRSALGSFAVGAVGSTGSLVNLIINLFIGLGVGVNVIAAQHIGAGRKHEIPDIIGTAIALALVCGVFVMGIGMAFSSTFLSWMDTPADILPLASKYLFIYFIGVPASLIYNFCAAVLRAYGDTKRPLIYLTVSGFVNVLLNMYFIFIVGLDVDGVAYATVISQYLSATLVVVRLLRGEDYCRFELRNIRFIADKVIGIVKVGLPAGIYSSMFSISNVIIQTAVNSFGSAVIVSGCAASSNVDNFVYTAVNAVSIATTSFAGQNMGARRFDRIRKVMRISFAVEVTIWAVVAGLYMIFRNTVFAFYLPDDPAAVTFGMLKSGIEISSYFILGGMDVCTGTLRGMGHSTLTTVISMIGTCGVRILWIFTVFYPSKAVATVEESIKLLFAVYPVSWIVTFIALFIFCEIMIARASRRRAMSRGI